MADQVRVATSDVARHIPLTTLATPSSKPKETLHLLQRTSTRPCEFLLFLLPLSRPTLTSPCSSCFTQAIDIDPNNHVLYSNRSGSYASLKDFDGALKDAVKTTELKPDWGKGWSRKGAALHGMGDLGMLSLPLLLELARLTTRSRRSRRL
jgi:hypothetical protein